MRVDIRRFPIRAGIMTCVAAAGAVALSPVVLAEPGSLEPGPAPGPVEPGPPPTDGTPHLASPDALPPGSTMDPAIGRDESPNVSYLKDLWHAVQNQEISGKEALILGLAQRGMNTPYPDQAPGPNVPAAAAAVAPEAPLAPAAPAGPETPAGPAAPDQPPATP